MNNDMNTNTHKQVLVVRKDLNMRKGKIGAQVSHASVKSLLDQEVHGIVGKILRRFGFRLLKLDNPTRTWLDGLFTKVCVSVGSEEELLEIMNKAEILGIRTARIIDSGLTEFKGVPTRTCVAIGPAPNHIIDMITGKLPLL